MSKLIGPVVLAIVVATGASRPAFAQPSHGHPQPHPHPGQGPQSGANLPVGTRTTGTWLDDASVIDPGSSWLALAWDDWRSPSGSQRFFPVANLSVGVTNRVQIQATVPYLYGGASSLYSTSAGFGDVYAGAKIVLTDPSASFGVAVMPTAEILSSQYVTDGTSRVKWVLPVGAELRRGPVRVYGTAGYFTRGAVFAGAGVDGQLNDRLALVATLTETSPTGTQLLPDGTPARSQVDVGGGAYVSVSDRVTLFGSVGRTISQLQADSTSSLVSIGMAINLRKGRTRLPIK